MKNVVRTAHGESTGYYTSDHAKHIFGTGQGSGGSPVFWLAVLDVILTVLGKELDGVEISNPQKKH